MNGLGNEIIVADMRGRADRVTPAAAIALNADPATKFDQIMAIHDPRTPGTDAYIEIINSDGSLAAGLRQRHALRRAGAGRRDRQKAFTFETVAGILNAEEHADGHDLRRHGQAALRLAGHPAGRGIPRHPRDRTADRPDRRAGAAFALGRLDGQSARHLLGRPTTSGPTSSTASARCSKTTRSFPSAPISRSPRSPRRTRIDLRTWERGAGLTQACGSAACAAAVSGRPHRPHRPQGDASPCPAATAVDRMARRRPCRHDRPGRMGIFRHASSRRPAPGRATTQERRLMAASTSSPSAAGSTPTNPR